MSRVGILTFPNSPSFGASLQMYALYKALSDLGLDVEIINYKNDFMKKQKHMTAHMSSIGRVKARLSSVLDLHGRKEFERFEKQVAMFPLQEISSTEELNDLNNRYDYFVCGSDQVWNPKITGNDMNYFFTFCANDAKKISYAASFGLNEIPNELKKCFSDALLHFKKLSVREERGLNIVKELTNCEATLVVDPTMLLPKSAWEELAKQVRSLPAHYIAKFIFNNDEQVNKFIQRLSEETGLPIITIGGNALSFLKKGRYTGSIGPQEWLYTIKSADYVVTDSFHGAAFSIIFERNLFVSTASSTNSRLITLCNNFELQGTIIQDNPNFSFNNRIDYSIVDALMQHKRKQSIDFLKGSLELK